MHITTTMFLLTLPVVYSLEGQRVLRANSRHCVTGLRLLFGTSAHLKLVSSLLAFFRRQSVLLIQGVRAGRLLSAEHYTTDIVAVSSGANTTESSHFLVKGDSLHELCHLKVRYES